MESLIYVKCTADGKIMRKEVWFLGMCLYIEEWPDDTEELRRPVGFEQYPIEAPSEVEDDYYFPDETEYRLEKRNTIGFKTKNIDS